MKERHFKLGKQFSVKIFKSTYGYEYYVYRNGNPHGPYIASSYEPTLAKAKSQAKKETVKALKRMRQTGDIKYIRISKKKADDVLSKLY